MRNPLLALLAITLAGLRVVAPGAEPQPAAGASEDYLVDIWDTDSGLPHSTVTSIAQTPDGYLWVGTLHGGLARFDGVRFVSFYPGNTPELKAVEVQRLLVDPEGTLWIGFVGGQKFSYKDGQFRYECGDARTPGSWLNELVGCRPDRLLMSTYAGWLLQGSRQSGTRQWRLVMTPDGNQVSSFCEDRDGVVWYRTRDGGLAQYRRGQFQRVKELAGLKSREITAVAKDPAGRIWVGTTRELARWQGDRFVDMTPTNGSPEIAVAQMTFCPDGSLWVRTPDSCGKAMNRSWVAQAKPWEGQLRPGRPLLMFGDNYGGVWVGHYGSGLWTVDATGHTVHIGEREGLPSELVECLFQDREGNVWVGLAGGGLARLRKRPFHLVWPAGLPHDRAARSICEGPEGAMWFGTSGETFLKWRHGAFTTFTTPAGAIAGRDGVVCTDAEGRVWAGGVQSGLWIIDGGQFKRPFPTDAVGTVARALCRDHAGRMWIGNEFGVYCWQTNALTHFSTNEGFGPGYVLSIAEGASGELWLGMADAELRRLKDGRFTRYRLERAASDIRFWALWPETNGVVWIGTLGAGLLRFEAGHFTRYTAEAGLPNEHVSQILADRRGQLWLGTRAGIACASKEVLEQFARGEIRTVPFITYGKFDGLPSAECSAGCQPGCCRDSEGRLWFATAKGAVWTRAGEVPFNPLPPQVHIEEVWVDGQRLQSSAWAISGTNDVARKVSGATHPMPALRVGPGRHYLEFHFTALSFTSPDKVRFRWQMQGLDPDWVDGRDKRTVSYSFIPPGSYCFRVQACNNDGVWNERGASLALTVLPAFWQTLWFRVLLGAGALAVVGLAYSVRMARLRALDRMRLRIARDLHDEVGANLGSITLLAQVMEKRPSAADATLVRGIAAQTVDVLRDIVWFIEPKHDRLRDLVTRLSETARTMLQGVPYHFETGGDMGSQTLPLEFRRNVVPIFKETLHNIVKHSHATQVQVSLRRTGHFLELQIVDNGTGFAEGEASGGNGLKNMRRRAAEMGGMIEVVSAPGKGCTVRLCAPIPLGTAAS